MSKIEPPGSQLVKQIAQAEYQYPEITEDMKALCSDAGLFKYAEPADEKAIAPGENYRYATFGCATLRSCTEALAYHDLAYVEMEHAEDGTDEFIGVSLFVRGSGLYRLEPRQAGDPDCKSFYEAVEKGKGNPTTKSYYERFDDRGLCVLSTKIDEYTAPYRLRQTEEVLSNENQVQLRKVSRQIIHRETSEVLGEVIDFFADKRVEGGKSVRLCDLIGDYQLLESVFGRRKRN